MSRYVEERRDVFGVEPICRAVGVPVSTYYARRSRKPSRRAIEDQTLVAEIYEAREGYRSVYGVPKTWKELRRDAGTSPCTSRRYWTLYALAASMPRRWRWIAGTTTTASTTSATLAAWRP